MDSVELKLQVANSGLPLTDRCIILTMIDKAIEFAPNFVFKTKASRTWMAACAGVSERTIARHIDALGIVTKYRKRGKGNPTVHIVDLSKILPSHILESHDTAQWFTAQASTQKPHVHLNDSGFTNQEDAIISGHLSGHLSGHSEPLARARGERLYIYSYLPDPEEDLKENINNLSPNAVPEPCLHFHPTLVCDHLKSACQRLSRVIDPPDIVIPNANLHHFIHHHSIDDAVVIAMYLTREGHSPGYISNGAYNPREARRWLAPARQTIRVGQSELPARKRPAPEPPKVRPEPRMACHRVFDDDAEAERRRQRDANIQRIAQKERQKRESQCDHTFCQRIEQGQWICRGCDKVFSAAEAHLYDLKE